MTVYTHTQMQNNWEVYAHIRQDALAFLDTRQLIPDVMYISEDGWIEAVYNGNHADQMTVTRWEQLVAETNIQMEKPLLNADNNTLRINFNLQPAQKGLWGRIKQLVS